MGCSSDKYSFPNENKENDEIERINSKLPKKRNNKMLFQKLNLKNNNQEIESENKNKIIVDFNVLFYTEEELREDYKYDDKNNNNIINNNEKKKEKINLIRKLSLKDQKFEKESIIEENSFEEEMKLSQNEDNKNEENILNKNDNNTNEENNNNIKT